MDKSKVDVEENKDTSMNLEKNKDTLSKEDPPSQQEST
jgi:hypothetical protein